MNAHTVDWVIAEVMCLKQGGRGGRTRYVLKDALKYIPMYGWQLGDVSTNIVFSHGSMGVSDHCMVTQNQNQQHCGTSEVRSSLLAGALLGPDLYSDLHDFCLYYSSEEAFSSSGKRTEIRRN